MIMLLSNFSIHLSAKHKIVSSQVEASAPGHMELHKSNYGALSVKYGA